MSLKQACSAALALILGCGGSNIDNNRPPPATASVQVSPGVSYQTIEGWDASLSYGAWTMTPASRSRLATEAAALGLNRITLEAQGQNIESLDGTTGQNDDSDPTHINPAGFHWTEFDERLNDFVLPLRQQITATGRPFVFVVRYIGYNPSVGFQQSSAAEYAEFVLAVLQHIKATFNLEPELWDTRNEPATGQYQVSAPQVGAMLAAAVARVRAAGFNKVRFIAPSPEDPNQAVSMFNQMEAVSGVTGNVAQLTYHRYKPANPGALAGIASRAAQAGITTGMTEHNTASEQELHEDLTQGNVSSWQKFALAGPVGTATTGNQLFWADLANDDVVLRPLSYRLGQYFRYVPPGSVRVGASSPDPVRPTAFRRPDGTYAVVVATAGANSIAVTGLPAGTYQVSYSTATQFDVHPGAATITAGQPLTLDIPAAGVITAAP